MKFYKAFDEVGNFITSMAIVIILLVPFMWYRYFELYTIFIKWIPRQHIANPELAAQLLAVVAIFITLLFMVNTARLFKGIKVILALTSFTLNILFWSLADEINWWFIVFISAVIASMDYGLAHLFDVMWKDRQIGAKLPSASQLYYDLKLKTEQLKEGISELQPLYDEYSEIKSKCYCDECDRTFPSPQSKNAHKCSPKL